MFGPKVPIDAKVLAKIDVTRGEMGGQIGLLRKEKLLVWPKPLKADTYETGRKQLTALFSDAVKQAKKGEVDAKLTETLDKTVGKMRERVDEQVANFSPDDYIEAARYLNKLNRAVTALRRKDVRDYFTATEEIPVKCRTVPDLVRYLSDKKFQLAPATPGDEPAYTELYKALQTYIQEAEARRNKI